MTEKRGYLPPSYRPLILHRSIPYEYESFANVPMSELVAVERQFYQAVDACCHFDQNS